MSTMTMDAQDAAGPSMAAPMFTCLSCSIGYPTPEDQRLHYRSDLHRYNMKRRVAGLAPVRADVFNEKVLERRAAASSAEQAETSSRSEGKCEPCGKNFASANAFKDHLNSKKHKESVAKWESKQTKAESSKEGGAAAAAVALTTAASDASESNDPPLVFRVPAPGKEQAAPGGLDSVAELGDSLPEAPSASKSAPSTSVASAARRGAALTVEEGATDEQVQALVDAKIASSRRVDPASECIFCSTKGFTSLDESLEHMRKAHSFFVPERDYLIDLPGLMAYLSDKIAVGNMCLYCNGRGKGFHSAEAARKHMVDKSHCKVAYDDEEDQLELSDFYDFTSSYPDAEWEDVSGDEGEDDDGEMVTDDGDSDASAELPPRGAGNGIRYSEGGMELILPSGARLGHRSLARYWNQSLRPLDENSASNTGRAIAHRLANDRNLIAQRMEKESSDGTLVAQRGGHVVKARNRGEAREAKRHIREFRDVQRREQHKTIVGFKNNSQKYFRDPLLQ